MRSIWRYAIAILMAVILVPIARATAVGLVDCSRIDDHDAFVKCSTDWVHHDDCFHLKDHDELRACTAWRTEVEAERAEESAELRARLDESQAEFDRLVRDSAITRCARDLLYVSMIRATSAFGMDLEQALRTASQDPGAVKAQVNTALLEGSRAMAQILQGLVVTDDEREMELIDICNDALAKSSLSASLGAGQ